MRCRLSWLCIALLVAGGCATTNGPIRVEPIRYDSDDGPVRGWLARIDLSDPAVEVVVTRPAVLFDGAAGRAETCLEPTPDWAERRGVVLAVNANYFSVVDDDEAAEAVALADVIGLCIAGGRVVSPQRFYDGVAGPALVIDHGGDARVSTRPDLDDAWSAVAGVGPSARAPALGGLLVTDGVNTGAAARVQPMVRHPRTAAGVDAAGATLWLVVIDGRQPGWSVGATLPELADVLIAAGADDAVNLDGGGSSSFVYRGLARRGGATSHTITNQPSGGSHRPVAAHLGVRLLDRD